MCTLTYLLNENGYELFFNRDEQHNRIRAIPPQFNQAGDAIYPIDPQGEGTWIAVNNKGLSLAILNYYQAPINYNRMSVSRGQIILSLLQSKNNIVSQLKTIDLASLQPFQLCIFPENLSVNNNKVLSVKWNGSKLNFAEERLPITSSSIDFDKVSEARKRRFNQLVNVSNPTLNQLEKYHFSTDSRGDYSVNMQRTDAKTVSISHISVNNTIMFKYFDNIVKDTHTITLVRDYNQVR